MSKLKPCPFCGMKHPVELYMDEETVNKGMYQVTCNALKGGCGSSSGYWYFEEDAIEAWNRRALRADYFVTSTTTNTPLYRYVSMEQIANAPTVEPASPWRRVEDGLPDLLQFVVVCNDEGKCVVAQYVGYQTDSLTPWRIAYTMYDTDIYDEKECGPVRYWMPIEPPEEEE